MNNSLKRLSLFTLCLFVSALSYLSFYSPAPFMEGKNYFTTPLYSHYQQQVKKMLLTYSEKAQTHPLLSNTESQRLNKLLTIIEKEMKTPDKQRAQYEELVTEIRVLAKEKTPLPFFSTLINGLFLEIDLNAVIQDFLSSHLMQTSAELDTLLQWQQQLSQDPSFQGLEGRPPFEDQLLQANIPAKLMTLSSSPYTRLIRIGQPVIESAIFPKMMPLNLSPEFAFFLRQQPAHLYVNLMKREGVEKKFTRFIENLEKEFSSLSVVTLDKNSSFYWQSSKEWADPLDAEHFKLLFLQQMLHSQGPYFWSSHLPFEWKVTLEKTIQNVHDIYFYSSPTLNKVERQDFIELVYVHILDQLVKQVTPTSMNITCRQGMDRGPSLATLWIYHKDLVSSKELAPLLLAPPLILHNRASHESRIRRFVSAAKRLNPQPSGAQAIDTQFIEIK